jgi:hypothetical protein
VEESQLERGYRLEPLIAVLALVCGCPSVVQDPERRAAKKVYALPTLIDAKPAGINV